MNNDFPEDILWADRPVLRKEDGNRYINEIMAAAAQRPEYNLDDLSLIEAIAREENIPFNRIEYSEPKYRFLTIFLLRNIQLVNARVRGGFESLSPLFKNYLFRTLLEFHNTKYTQPTPTTEFILFKSVTIDRNIINNFAPGKEVFWNFFTTLSTQQHEGNMLFAIKCSSRVPLFCSPGLFSPIDQGPVILVPGTRLVVQSVNLEHFVVELRIENDEQDFIFGDAFAGIVEDLQNLFVAPTHSVVRWKCSDKFGRDMNFSIIKGLFTQQLVKYPPELLYKGKNMECTYELKQVDCQYVIFFFCSVHIGPYEIFSTKISNYVATIDTNALGLVTKYNFTLGFNGMPKLSWMLRQAKPIVDPSRVVYTLYPVYNGTAYQGIYTGKDTSFVYTESLKFGNTYYFVVAAQLINERGEGQIIAQGNISFTVSAPTEQIVPELTPEDNTSNSASFSIDNYSEDFKYRYFFWNKSAPTQIFAGDSNSNIIHIHGLEPNTQYVVTAANYRDSWSGISTFTEVETQKLDPIPPNQQPRNFRVRRELYSSIEVEWDRGDGCTDDNPIFYNVLYRPRDNDNNDWYKSVHSQDQDLCVVLPNLLLNKEYEISLTATGRDGKYFRVEKPIYASTKLMDCVQNAGCAELTPTEARIQWDRVPHDQVLYQITLRGFNFAQQTPENTFTLSNLNPNMRYIVDVTVYRNDIGCISNPATIEFVTPQLKQLPPPQNIRAEEVTDSSITLAWDDNGLGVLGAGAESRNAHYAVYCNAGNGNFVPVYCGRDPRCVVNGLRANAEHHFQVVPMYDKNYSGAPSAFSAKTRGFVFENNGFECVSKTTDAIELKWNPFPSQQAYYVIYDVTQSPQKDMVCRATDTTCTIQRLKPDTEYKLSISAIVAERGESDPSDPPLVVKTKALYVPPAVPNVRTSEVTHEKFAITWDQVANPPVPVKYFMSMKRADIPMDGDVMFCGTWEEFVREKKNTIVCDRLEPASEYAVEVYAKGDRKGEVTVLKVRTKRVPTLLSPENMRVTHKTHSTMEVAWDAAKCDGIEDPKILYRVSINDNVVSQEFDACEYCFTDLKPKTVYKVDVTAFAKDTPFLSLPASVREETLQHVIEPPSNFRCTKVTSDTIVVAWDSVAGSLLPGEVLQYKIDYRKDYESNFSNKTKIVSDDTCELEVHNLSENTGYVFTLRASCDNGKSYDTDKCAKITVRTSQQPLPELTGLVPTGFGPTYVTITWNAAKYPRDLKYVVNVYEESSGKQVANQETSQIIAYVENLTEDTDYRTEVMCLRGDGVKGPAAVGKFRTPKDRMERPSSLIADCDAFDRATITWKPPAVDSKIFKKEDVYYVLDLTCNGITRSITVDEYDKTVFVFDNLIPNTKYSVALCAARRVPKNLVSDKVVAEFVTPCIPIPDPKPTDFKTEIGAESVVFRLVAEDKSFDGPNPLLRVSVDGKEPATDGNRGPITVDGLAPSSEHIFEVQYTDPTCGASKTCRMALRTTDIKSTLFTCRDKGAVRLLSSTKVVKVAPTEMKYKDKPTIITINKDRDISLAFGRERVSDNLCYILVGLCEEEKVGSASIFGDGYFLDIGMGTVYAGYPFCYFAHKVPDFKLFDMPDGRKRVDISILRGEKATSLIANGVPIYDKLPEKVVPIVSILFEGDSVEILNP